MGKFFSKIFKPTRRVFTLRNFFILIVLLLIFSQYLQIHQLLDSASVMKANDAAILKEMGRTEQAYLQFTADLNEVRGFLGLPTNEYPSLSASEEEDSETETDQNKLALFKYLEFLGVNQDNEANLELYKELLTGLKDSKEFNGFLTAAGLKFSALNDSADTLMLVISNNTSDLVTFFLSKSDGTFSMRSILEKKEITPKTFEEFIRYATTYVTTNKENIIAEIKNVKDQKALLVAAVAAPSFINEIGKLTISLGAPLDNSDQFKYQIMNKLAEPIGEIILVKSSAKIELMDLKNDANNLTASNLNKDLIAFLNELDRSTAIEQKVTELKKKFNEYFADKGLQLVLKENGLSVQQPREDNLRIYYDVYDVESRQISSIVIEKATGIVNIVNSDGTNGQNMLFFDPDSKKKILNLPDFSNIPKYGNELLHKDKTFNVLVGGKNGSLMDTIIFAHVNEYSKKIQMISIPRDLFYDNKKINSYAFFNGMPAFKKLVSELSGYKIDKYVVIDMNAFVDVINLLGGLDVHLDKALVDPNYRTVDNGKSGTLYYEPGDYHLGGKEVLRLARSRKSTSDFARADRQQMILKSLQKVAQNFGLGDVKTIYQIIKAVLAKTETDVSFEEAVNYFFRYKDFDIQATAVMSSGNVLYSPPYISEEQCKQEIDAAALAGTQKPDCEKENHAYTLLPRDDNWDIIKWFFRQNFE